MTKSCVCSGLLVNRSPNVDVNEIGSLEELLVYSTKKKPLTHTTQYIVTQFENIKHISAMKLYGELVSWYRTSKVYKNL